MNVNGLPVNNQLGPLAIPRMIGRFVLGDWHCPIFCRHAKNIAVDAKY